MKRSEINAVMRDVEAFLGRMGFRLPPFAFWTPEDWSRRGPECRGIVRECLGWDITDFGSGSFDEVGLFLFTLRNGVVDAHGKVTGRPYAEKVMIVRERQITPTHFHWSKIEDIINRGGGDLVIQLWGSTPDEALSPDPVTVRIDSVARTVEAGGIVTLTPGESICLERGVYHKFWGREGGGPVLVGEVSLVNDDRRDNRFLEPVGRFPTIDEDEPPLRLLCGEYGRWYRHAG